MIIIKWADHFVIRMCDDCNLPNLGRELFGYDYKLA